MILKITTPQGDATVNIVNGRVVTQATSAALQRLCGLSEAALRNYAATRGWEVRVVRGGTGHADE